jgi:hypothetical protein
VGAEFKDYLQLTAKPTDTGLSVTLKMANGQQTFDLRRGTVTATPAPAPAKPEIAPAGGAVTPGTGPQHFSLEQNGQTLDLALNPAGEGHWEGTLRVGANSGAVLADGDAAKGLRGRILLQAAAAGAEPAEFVNFFNFSALYSAAGLDLTVSFRNGERTFPLSRAEGPTVPAPAPEQAPAVVPAPVPVPQRPVETPAVVVAAPPLAGATVPAGGPLAGDYHLEEAGGVQMTLALRGGADGHYTGWVVRDGMKLTVTADADAQTGALKGNVQMKPAPNGQQPPPDTLLPFTAQPTPDGLSVTIHLPNGDHQLTGTRAVAGAPGGGVVPLPPGAPPVGPVPVGPVPVGPVPLPAGKMDLTIFYGQYRLTANDQVVTLEIHGGDNGRAAGKMTMGDQTLMLIGALVAPQRMQGSLTRANDPKATPLRFQADLTPAGVNLQVMMAGAPTSFPFERAAAAKAP